MSTNTPPPAYWIKLDASDIARILNPKEAAIVCQKSQSAEIEEDIFDLTCRVREAVASNGSNALSADATLIPRTLRASAMHILRIHWLSRYAIPITQDRRDSATAAEEQLRKVAAGELKILDENGQMPTHADEQPAIIAPSPAYGVEGIGWYPTP